MTCTHGNDAACYACLKPAPIVIRHCDVDGCACRMRVRIEPARASRAHGAAMSPAIVAAIVRPLYPQPKLPCTIRAGKPDDLAYVVDSWTKHAFRGQRMRTATAHVRALLARPGSVLRVAHVVGEPDAILGWIVAEDGKPACVHYVYVRSAARGQGVATAMLGTATRERIEYSTECSRAPAVWTFNPKAAVTE